MKTKFYITALICGTVAVHGLLPHYAVNSSEFDRPTIIYTDTKLQTDTEKTKEFCKENKADARCRDIKKENRTDQNDSIDA